MENRIFTVATSHLDTVWRWELPKTIEVFIPDTIEKNLELLEHATVGNSICEFGQMEEVGKS